jgi:hypothetical protein
MRLSDPQNAPEVQGGSVFVSEGGSASFAVPIRTCLRRELPTSPGHYLILLRQQRSERISRPWKWGRIVGEM